MFDGSDFMYPWQNFRDFDAGISEMFAFIAILLVGFFYNKAGAPMGRLMVKRECYRIDNGSLNMETTTKKNQT